MNRVMIQAKLRLVQTLLSIDDEVGDLLTTLKEAPGLETNDPVITSLLEFKNAIGKRIEKTMGGMDK